MLHYLKIIEQSPLLIDNQVETKISLILVAAVLARVFTKYVISNTSYGTKSGWTGL